MNRNVLSRRVFAGVAIAALALAGCSSKGDPGTDPSASADAGGLASITGELKASGASFPNTYYQEVILSLKDAAPNFKVTYNSVGSGTGKKEFGSGLVDFAGTDSTVKDTDGVPAGSYLYVPTVAAPITVSYNLKGVDKLQLSPVTLAKIFQRTIKTWNAPEIVADNPGVTLPATAISVAHRSDGSGTTNNFTKYLAAAAPSDWKLGSGDTVAWPADTQAGAKNTGVAQLIKAADGGIGYVDLSDAKDSGLAFAAIKNKDGQYVLPTLEGATAALAGAEVKDDLTFNPLNAAGAATYPITAPTYLLVKPKYDDPKKAELVKAFVKYVLTDGKAIAAEVNYAVLPTELQTKALAQLDKVS
ncbi:phosphate ABC transporter substrate-binding protein PstS [Catellatospora citrea]|uniref:Phosphate-binding protein n=1 Tax=Catellatospora citrea TaxID=53366 RepID=A0A8J3KSY2_9ACTN|nr:phosphate ABC transporter substrate-binding protein PstS [Catellatospora citrea]RKE08525.1 phosphate ABC transporter substrate-binding protein (PhoT family) [Catellatospora citrea]GIG01390.1 phosphate-binding protein [Catellatospora citrea]